MASAIGHTLPFSFLTIVPDENYLHLELTLNPFELTGFTELDGNRDGRLDAAECERGAAKITAQLLGAVTVRVDGRRIEPDIAGLTPSYESHHVTVRAHYAVNARQAAVTVESGLAGILGGSHFTQVSFGTGDHTQAARLDRQSNRAQFAPPESLAVTPNPTPPHATRSPGTSQRQPSTAVVLTCLVSLLLAAIGSTALLMRSHVVIGSKANSSGL